jgi:Tol biopolymer transport system component
MGRLLNVPVTGGAFRLVLEDVDGPIAFSPDGKQFAFMRKKEIEGGTLESILVASVADASDQRAILTKSDTQVGWTIAWSPAPVLVDAFFPIRLNRAAQPIISVLSPSGVVKQEIPVSGFRRLRYPVWLNHGSLLLFAALADGSTDFEQRVQEFSVYSGKSRPLESPMALGSLSATLDGNFVAAVGLKQESSLWIANPNQAATKQMTESGSVRSFAWVDRGVVFPSARGGSVNLWETLAGGRARPVGKARPCVEYEPSYLPGNAVVYSSNCASGGGDFNIWKTDLQTGVATQLTSGGNFDTYPEASPDGKLVIYNSWPSNVPSIWKVAIAGGMPNRVYSEQGRNAVFSPDGQRIVCQVRAGRGNPWRVVILAFSDGHILQEIPSVPANPDVPIRWSPDGAALEYLAGTGGHSILWRQPLAGGSPVQILNVPGENIHDFARSPDGKKLAYIQSRADSNVVLIRRANRP